MTKEKKNHLTVPSRWLRVLITIKVPNFGFPLSSPSVLKDACLLKTVRLSCNIKLPLLSVPLSLLKPSEISNMIYLFFFGANI